jgi:hypothetical protein
MFLDHPRHKGGGEAARQQRFRHKAPDHPFQTRLAAPLSRRDHEENRRDVAKVVGVREYRSERRRVALVLVWVCANTAPSAAASRWCLSMIM